MKNSVRIFYLLIITQSFSMLGSIMTSFAIGIKVFNDTGDVTPLALVAFFSQLPMILGANIAGVLADRWDRKKVLILSDAGQAVATLFLLVSFATNNFELWHLYAVAMLESFFAVFQMPAFTATMTLLVPDEKRDLANTIQQINRPAAGIIAPVLASFLYVLVDVAGVMLFDLVTFLVAMGVVMMVHIPRPKETQEGRDSRGSVWKESLTGFKFLWSRRPLFILIMHAMLLNFLFNMGYIMNTPYVLSITGSEQTLGFVSAMSAVGPVVGGIIFGMWRRNIKRIHVIYPAILFMAFFMMLYGVARSPLTLILFSLLAMVTNPAANATLMSLMQQKTPPDIQGRVFAAIMQMAMFATPLAYLIVGPLVDGVIEPLVGTSGWDLVAPLVGNQTGSGMGLILFINGAVIFGLTIFFYTLPMMRNIEELLPNYVAEEADDDADNEPISTADVVETVAEPSFAS